MKSKKILIAVLAAVLLGTAVFAAAVGFRQPETKSGAFYQKLADRMDITVENTAFTLVWDEEGDNAFELPLTVTLKKTEPDFYAKLLGITVEGLEADALEIADVSGKGALTKDGVLLPVENGEAVPLTYSVKVRFTAESDEALSPTLVLHYISGMTEGTADERYLEIPLEITF